MRLVFLGLSITSSWGNGHATTYRALLRALVKRGHQVIFLERDMPWYAENRDLPRDDFLKTELYGSIEELKDRFTLTVREADCVIVGSYVPEGVKVGQWIVESTRGIAAFYDIDTPVTLAKLENGDYEYFSPELISRFRIYLSFTGGPILKKIQSRFHSPMVRAFYCSVDPETYYPISIERKWDLSYLGTYSDDRQLALNKLIIEPAKDLKGSRFVVAGPQYPDLIEWPEAVERIQHLPPIEHRDFYNSSRFTLNLTRADMVRAGYSPSVRLFEAAACGVPIISDYWNGLFSFFAPDSEILIADSAEQMKSFLLEISEEQRLEIGRRARERVLRQHTAAHRAVELENYIQEAMEKSICTEIQFANR